MNVLKHHGILAGPMGRTAKDLGVFIGNSAFPMLATAGGLVELWSSSTTELKRGRRSPFSATASAR